MVRKLLNRRDNEIAAVGSVNASLLRVSVFLAVVARTYQNRSDIFFRLQTPFIFLMSLIFL